MAENYEIVSRIGAGGMGTVYRARQPGLDRDIALKILRANVELEPDLLKRFRRESEIQAALNHPDLVKVLDAGTREDGFYLAMELVEGCNLSQYIARSAPLPEDFVLQVMRRVAGALAYLHDQNIFHRDIKPANILIADDGRVKLTDFGLSRGVDHTQVTGDREILGTIPYMAPESLAKTAPSGPAVDIYALGMTCYEMVTGQVAFPAARLVDHLRELQTRVPVPPRDLVPGVSLELNHLLVKMLASEPSSRPAAREVSRILERMGRQRGTPDYCDPDVLYQLREDPQSTARAARVPRPTRRATRKWAPFVLALVALLVWALWPVDSFEDLRRAAESPNAARRRAAVAGLARRPATAPTTALLQELLWDDDISVATAAWSALDRSGLDRERRIAYLVASAQVQPHQATPGQLGVRLSTFDPQPTADIVLRACLALHPAPQGPGFDWVLEYVRQFGLKDPAVGPALLTALSQPDAFSVSFALLWRLGISRLGLTDAIRKKCTGDLRFLPLILEDGVPELQTVDRERLLEFLGRPEEIVALASSSCLRKHLRNTTECTAYVRAGLRSRHGQVRAAVLADLAGELGSKLENRVLLDLGPLVLKQLKKIPTLTDADRIQSQVVRILGRSPGIPPDAVPVLVRLYYQAPPLQAEILETLRTQKPDDAQARYLFQEVILSGTVKLRHLALRALTAGMDFKAFVEEDTVHDCEDPAGASIRAVDLYFNGLNRAHRTANARYVMYHAERLFQLDARTQVICLRTLEQFGIPGEGQALALVSALGSTCRAVRYCAARDLAALSLAGTAPIAKVVDLLRVLHDETRVAAAATALALDPTNSAALRVLECDLLGAKVWPEAEALGCLLVLSQARHLDGLLIPNLLGILRRGTSRSMLLAARLLRQVGLPARPFAARLRESLRSVPDLARLEIAALLLTLDPGDATGQDALTGLLSAKDDLLEPVSAALSGLPPGLTATVFSRALDRPDCREPVAVAFRLGQVTVGTADALRALNRRLTDPNPAVREAASRSIATLRPGH